MSIESAKAYIEKLKNDEAFRNKALSCTNAEERKAFVKAEGFDFTVDEIKQLVSKIDDSELEGLAAGGGLNDAWNSINDLAKRIGKILSEKCSSH